MENTDLRESDIFERNISFLDRITSENSAILEAVCDSRKNRAFKPSLQPISFVLQKLELPNPQQLSQRAGSSARRLGAFYRRNG